MIKHVLLILKIPMLFKFNFPTIYFSVKPRWYRFLNRMQIKKFSLIFPFLSVDYKITQKNFNFANKHNLPFYYVSAADGTNVVKVNNIFIQNLIVLTENVFVIHQFKLSLIKSCRTHEKVLTTTRELV